MRVAVVARSDWPPGGVARAADALAAATGSARVVIGRVRGVPGRFLFDPLRVALADVDLLHLDTSARPRALLRDAVLIGVARRPVVVRVHGMERLAPRRVLQRAYGRASAVLAVCEAHAARLGDALQRPVGVLSPGWVPHPARRTRGPGRPVVLFGGRADAAKGLDRLVAAMEGLDAELRVAGDGPVGGGRRLGWLPPDRWRQEVADADLVCLPSWDEGVPIVLLEAMASGIPVVATAVGGVSELVRDGRDGVVLPCGVGVEGLRHALSTLLADSDGRKRMGRSARERAQAHRIDVVARSANAVWARAC